MEMSCTRLLLPMRYTLLITCEWMSSGGNPHAPERHTAWKWKLSMISWRHAGASMKQTTHSGIHVACSHDVRRCPAAERWLMWDSYFIIFFRAVKTYQVLLVVQQTVQQCQRIIIRSWSTASPMDLHAIWLTILRGYTLILNLYGGVSCGA